MVISSARGHSEVVTILLEARANINHQDKVMPTVLSLSVK